MIGEGFIADKAVFTIREMRIGKSTVRDLKVTVNQRLKASLLLGESTLRKFGEFSIDSADNKIIFE